MPNLTALIHFFCRVPALVLKSGIFPLTFIFNWQKIKENILNIDLLKAESWPFPFLFISSVLLKIGILNLSFHSFSLYSPNYYSNIEAYSNQGVTDRCTHSLIHCKVQLFGPYLRYLSIDLEVLYSFATQMPPKESFLMDT